MTRKEAEQIAFVIDGLLECLGHSALIGGLDLVPALQKLQEIDPKVTQALDWICDDNTQREILGLEPREDEPEEDEE